MNNYKQLRQEGDLLFAEGRYQESIDKLTGLLNTLSQQFREKRIKDQKEGRYLIKTVKLPSLKTISQCQYKLGLFDQSLITCNQILKIDSDCGATIYTKGLIKIQQNQIQEAQKLFQRACVLEPDNETFKNKYQEIKAQYAEKFTCVDRVLSNVSLIVGWFLSVFALLIALIAFVYKVMTLVKIFIVNNLERLQKLIVKYWWKWVDMNVSFARRAWRGLVGKGRSWLGRMFGRKEKIL